MIYVFSHAMSKYVQALIIDKVLIIERKRMYFISFKQYKVHPFYQKLKTANLGHLH